MDRVFGQDGLDFKHFESVKLSKAYPAYAVEMSK